MPARRPASGAAAWLLLLLALGLLVFAAWRGWSEWQGWRASSRMAAERAGERVAALESSVAALRSDHRAQARRLQQAEATNRLLRDDLLGIGQRAGLLEDTVSKLADPDRHGAQALRIDEVELLLSQGQQRLLLSGDLDGARRAYALAAGLLAGVEDPAYLNLRQALLQERSMLEALGADPKQVALGRLEAFAAALPVLPAGPAPSAAASWWRRALARVVQVRPSNQVLAASPGDRAAGMAALQLELSLARAAIERRDAPASAAALARAEGWLERLWPESAELRRQRQRLRALRALPLAVDLPTLGSTLAQLQALRAAR